jgi:flap endonuclease-1
MGIKGLTALISEHAPKAIRVRRPCVNTQSPSLTFRGHDAILDTQEHDIKNLFGRKVAIDASMSIYQFLIAVRQRDGEMLMNDAGETTRSGRVLFAPTGCPDLGVWYH